MNTRENKAITLIALVVTIIVLLILASVSLNLVLGEHGIITMAKTAKENTELAQVQEQAELNQLYEQLYNGGSSGNGGDSGNLGENTGGSESTGGSGGTGSSSLTGKDIKKDNYGEYIDYGLDINENGDTTDDWRIFYTNDDGRIFLIAADYVPNTCAALITAIDEEHSNMISFSKYGYYWNSAPIYDCNDGHNITLNQNKAQCSFPELFMPTTDFCSSDKHYYCSEHVGSDGAGGFDSSRYASALQCTENWKPFIEMSSKKDYAEYAIGGPTIEMWVASWNKVHGSGTTQGITLYANGSGIRGYYVGETAECTTKSYSFGLPGTVNDTLYFVKLKYGDYTFDYYYLSSPANDVRNLLAIQCSTGDIENYNDKGTTLRPVVCLKEGVKLTKNTSKSTDEKIVYDLSM